MVRKNGEVLEKEKQKEQEQEIASEALELVKHGLSLLESQFYDDSIEILRQAIGLYAQINRVSEIEALNGKISEIYLVSDEYRKVYLWNGVNSNVRSKFIGAKRSQDIRGQVGMHFGVVPLDEGDEDPDFLKLIGGRLHRFDDEDRFPYPYVFKPPEPPDDLALAPGVQLHTSPKKKDPDERINCQFCGRKLTMEEQISHSCKEKPEKNSS